MAELTVLEQKISYLKIEDEDYISITDMLKSKDGDFFVSDWLRNRNTIEFLGIWEEIHNPNFNWFYNFSWGIKNSNYFYIKK